MTPRKMPAAKAFWRLARSQIRSHAGTGLATMGRPSR